MVAGSDRVGGSKKRQRIILVCDTCHKRKIKCNRKLPCDACKGKKMEALCRYSTLEEELSKQGKSTEEAKASEELDHEVVEVIRLRNRISQLERALELDGRSNFVSSTRSPRNGSNSTVGVPTPLGTLNSGNSSPNGLDMGDPSLRRHTDFFTNKFQANSCYRLNDSYIASCPLLFLSIIKKDVGYVLFWHFNRLKAQQEKFAKQSVEGLQGLGTLVDAHSEDNNEKVMVRAKDYFGPSFIPLVDKNGYMEDQTRSIINTFYSGDGTLLFNPTSFPSTSNTYYKIQHLLPPRSIILQYLDIFFDKMEPYFPVFEKNSFTADVMKLVTEESCDNVEVGHNFGNVKLNLEKKTDIARVSSLLFILRFTYLYVVGASKYNLQLQGLLQYPIYIEVIIAAREGLKEFDLATNKLFAVLQTFIMAKIYKTTSPDQGEGLKETDIYISTLIGAAYVLGLNRDPNIYAHDNLSWIDRNHRRKVWFYLLLLKALELLIYGRNSFEEIQTDVKLEQLNSPEDNSLYNSMIKLKPIKGLINDLVKVLLNIKELVNIDYFTSTVAKIEQLIDENYPSVDDMINSHINGVSSPTGTYDLIILVALKLFVVKMHAALYIIFETRDEINSLFYHFKKMSTMVFIELQPLCSVIHDYGDQLDPVFSLVFFPHVIKILISFIILALTFILRLNYSIKLYTGTQEKPLHFFGLRDDIQFLGYNLLRYSGKISNKYQMAWKASRAILYGLNETKDYRTFEEFCDGRTSAWIFSTDQIHEICDILSVASGIVRQKSMIPNTPSDFVWLDLVPYDTSKLQQENLEIQRLHVYQVDSVWSHYLASLQETVPDSFKNSESDFSTDLPGFLDNDIFTGGLAFNSGLASLFSIENFYSND